MFLKIKTCFFSLNHDVMRDCFSLSLLKPFLEKHLKLQDTCGVHNLHAVPGMLGGFTGAIVAAAATESVYSREG